MCPLTDKEPSVCWLNEVRCALGAPYPLTHLMLETGLRVNERCGLKVEDLVLDAETPYVIVQKNPFRRLKTTSSRRYTPLVGVASNAVTRECEGKEAKDWLFSS